MLAPGARGDMTPLRVTLLVPLLVRVGSAESALSSAGSWSVTTIPDAVSAPVFVIVIR